MHGPTIACRRCGRVVSAEAPRCPECRADPRTGLSSYRGGERDCVRVCEGVGLRFGDLAARAVVVRPRTMPAEEIAATRLPTAPWPGAG